jgi:hypothetical protein
MRAHIAELSRIAGTLVCAYPNAGLPNEFGLYDESPEFMAGLLAEFASGRPGQYRRRLLRHHAGAYRAIADAVKGQAAAQDSRGRALCCACPASSRSRSRPKSRSSMWRAHQCHRARPSSASW